MLVCFTGNICTLFVLLLLTPYILLRIPTNDVNGGQSLFEILNGYVLKFHKCCEALSLIFCCCGVAKHHVQFNLRSNKIGQAGFFVKEHTAIDILFSSNHNIHKRSHGLCFRASNPLIDRFH